MPIIVAASDRDLAVALGIVHAHLRMIIEPDGAMRDETTGIAVDNRLQRALALVCGVSWSGYHMLADDAATEASNRELRTFLERVFHRSAAPRRASA